VWRVSVCECVNGHVTCCHNVVLVYCIVGTFKMCCVPYHILDIITAVYLCSVVLLA
jgi:hypothetical protein